MTHYCEYWLRYLLPWRDNLIQVHDFFSKLWHLIECSSGDTFGTKIGNILVRVAVRVFPILSGIMIAGINYIIWFLVWPLVRIFCQLLLGILWAIVLERDFNELVIDWVLSKNDIHLLRVVITVAGAWHLCVIRSQCSNHLSKN